MKAEFARLGRRRAVVFVIVTAILASCGFSLISSMPVRGATFTLYGRAGAGWGSTSASQANPGPTLVVQQGEMVHIDLYSADDPTFHTWCIDYSNNNACEAGENESQPFQSMTTPVPHMFFPTRAGTYHYVCGFHGGISMWGVIQINPAPGPVNPTVAISSPNGSERWTGNSVHNIVWTMTDPQEPVSSLNASVAYSSAGANGPWTLIAGPIPGSANPHSLAWTVPCLDSGSVYVNVTATDPLGNQGWVVAPVPAIDCTPPSVIDRSPPNGSPGIPISTNVVVTFDEAMNRGVTASPATAALQDLSTLGWVEVTYSWGSGDAVLTMDPVPTLAPTTMYRASINVSARDASDPGNALSMATAWVFTTATGADVTPPQISNVVSSPAIQEYPAPVAVTATITDDVTVASAWVSVTRPDLSRLNLSMTVVSGTTWTRSQAYATTPAVFASVVGNYVLRVEATDSSGNWNRSAQGTFTVRDTTPPGISNLVATPSPAEVYEPVNVTVLISDPFPPTSAVIVVNGTNALMSPGAPAGAWYYRFTPMRVQTYLFSIATVDRAGNVASSNGSVIAQDTKPPPMPTDLTAIVIGDGIQLSWTGVTAFDLDGYKVYRSTSPSGPFTTQVGPPLVSGTAFADRTAQTDTTYYYVVTAVDAGGRESMPSIAASAVVRGLDLTPVLIGGAAIGIILAALAVVFVLRRRREKTPKG